MYNELIDTALSRLADQTRSTKAKAQGQSPLKMLKVHDRIISYTHRHRKTWFRPEYDFDEIQIAQDTDAYIFRSIQKKVNRVIIAGYEFVGDSSESVDYIKRRIAEMSHLSQRPFEQQLTDTFHDMFRYSNCMWSKVRDKTKSTGQVRKVYEGSSKGTDLQPVAGYFILPFETLEFKTKRNGELLKLMQKSTTTGDSKEFSPNDVIHFYTNKKPGFAVGTPELLPVLDDVALLRRIEENVEELVDTNLFPVFHYTIGTDEMPERVGPDGLAESERVKTTLEYMPSGGIYVSDHRHKIEAIGSEGRALRMDFYLEYFKKRVLAGLGTSPVDHGEGASANRSTASTMSKVMLMDVEAMTVVVKWFIEFYVLRELLLEGGFDPLDAEQMVHIKFGVIDKEEKRADENHQTQLFTTNIKDLDETRKGIGEKPWTEEQFDRTHHKLYEEPLALIRALGPGAAAGDALAENPVSNITSAGIKKESTFAQETAKAKAAGQQGRPTTNTKSSSAKKTITNRNQPTNQHGTRASAKTTNDFIITAPNGELFSLTCDGEIEDAKVHEWEKLVNARYATLDSEVIDYRTIAKSMVWRLTGTS